VQPPICGIGTKKEGERYGCVRNRKERGRLFLLTDHRRKDPKVQSQETKKGQKGQRKVFKKSRPKRKCLHVNTGENLVTNVAAVRINGQRAQAEQLRPKKKDKKWLLQNDEKEGKNANN